MSFARKSLDLDFTLMAKNGYLDPILKFSRDSAATRINPTTGQLETLAANVPRLEKEGLLIEGAATNLLEYSSPLAWNHGVTGATVCQGPDGTATAMRLPAGWGRCPCWSGLRTGAFTGSIYVRAVDGTPSLNFILGPGRVVTGNLTQQWQRITNTVDYTEYMLIDEGSGGHAVEIAHAQLEAGSVATSYIPTAGAHSTRESEFCFLSAQAPWFSSDAGTLLCDVTSFVGGGVRAFEIGKDDWQNALFMQFSTYGAEFIATVTGAVQASQFIGPPGRNKLALSWSGGRLKNITSNGKPSTALDATMPPIERIAIGSVLNGPWGSLNGHIRSLRISPTAVNSLDVLAAMSEL